MPKKLSKIAELCLGSIRETGALLRVLFRIKEMTSLPTFLPNPSRVLLASFDAWASKSTDSSRDKMITLNALMRALKEAGSAASPRVESIPYLIATEDPPMKWCSSLPVSAPPLEELLL